MYHPFSFSDNNLPKITTIDGRIDYGYQATHLSEGDLIEINNMYPEINSEGTNIREIKNPSFSQKRIYKNNSTSTCSCFEWYNLNFPMQAGSSTDSNDDPGTEGGDSIKLTYDTEDNQRTAYQLIEGLLPGVTYNLSFYYSIKRGTDNSGQLDFRILNPNAITPSSVNNNTVEQFIGDETANTSSIDASNGGGQIVELRFTASTNAITLYAVNSKLASSDVRIDNY